jgi:BirA family biotin operon repressor/biotin-[acetyl-CoA-carboxylase] ligase
MKINWFDIIDSTNSAIKRDKMSLDTFSVYVANYQGEGRGQRGNVWESEVGKNLLLSILLRPSALLAKDQFILSQAISLAIVDYLKIKGVAAKIKWPNDIYVEDKKICGILIENTLAGEYLSDSVVGIGLNLNQKVFVGDAPNPVSLSMITGKEYVIGRELEVLLECIHRYYELAVGGESALLKSRYLSTMYRLGEMCCYRDLVEGCNFWGKIVDVDPQARLIIDAEGGELKRFAFKEVAFVV